MKTLPLLVPLAVTALIASSLGTTGCRSQKKGVRVGSEAATLKVQMANLDEKDQNKPNWIYELSGCISPLNGELGENNVVSFSAVGLKQGLPNCQFRVKVVSSPQGIVFAADAEQNVLYWSRELELTSDATGQLSAIAGLQRLYQIVPSYDATQSFTLQVPVRFPNPETATPITGEIKCNPQIANIGLYTQRSPTEGVLTFPVAIDQVTDFECNQVFVSVAGVAGKYLGSLVAGAGRFKGTPNETTELGAVDVQLQKPGEPPNPPNPPPPPPPPPGTDNVDVETKPGQCAADQVYDTDKHACVKKP